MREKNFERKVRNYLKKIGAWHVKYWGGGFSQAGIPDILACVNGFFVAIEVKSETGKPSELQKLNVLEINESGGVACILYPQGFDEFKLLCEELNECNFHTQELKRLKTVHTSLNCDTSPKLKP